MKRLKRVTKREKKAMAKFLKELKEKESSVETTVPKKANKVKPIFSLKKYFANKAQKRLEKLQHRQDKREAKAHAGHKH